MQHRDRIVLKKIISEIDIGIEMLGETSLEVFLHDEMLKRAIGMTVINIGELTKNVTSETRAAYPAVPWKEVAGFRDIAAHKYQTLRMEDVYLSVAEDFPALKTQLVKILSQEASL